MYKITYYVGCNDKDTLKQELSDEFFISVLDGVFDNYTLSQTQGRFTNKDGVRTLEKSFVVTLIEDENSINTKDQLINSTARILKHKLNQESILVTKELIQANFI